MVGVIAAVNRWAVKLSQTYGLRKGRTAILKPEVETECDAESRVDVLKECLAALSEACWGLCGREFPHELGMLVLLEYGGMRSPSAVAFLGEQKMWTWIRIYESVLADAHKMVTAARLWNPCGMCQCGAENLPVAVERYCTDVSYYGRGTMTKTLACHYPHRISNIGSRWVKEGPWKVEDPTRMRWRDQCSMTELWLGLWFNTSEALASVSRGIQQLYHMNRNLRFRQGLMERDFLYSANREQIREAIANVNGTEKVRIEGDDYTSRAEWVRVFYNSLRPRPLKSWPHADA